MIRITYIAALLAAMWAGEARAHCIVYPVDVLGNSPYQDLYRSQVDDEVEVPVEIIMNADMIDAFRESNPGEDLRGWCNEDPPATVIRNWHCIVTQDDTNQAANMCQHDATERTGYWSEVGEWVEYETP